MTDEEPETIDIGDGAVIPARLGSKGTFAIDGAVFEVVVDARYDPSAGRYLVEHVAMTAREGGEVTGEVLRRVKLAESLRLIARAAMSPYEADWPRELAAAGPTTETLRAVAQIYRVALLAGDAPTQAVAERLGVPRSTAGRWVTRARDRGFLTVVDPRASRTEGRPDGE
jgi:hypothetical protein